MKKIFFLFFLYLILSGLTLIFGFLFFTEPLMSTYGDYTNTEISLLLTIITVIISSSIVSVCIGTFIQIFVLAFFIKSLD